MRAENLDFSFSNLRWAAYSGYILWQFGKLGKGNRKVVPGAGGCVQLIKTLQVAEDRAIKPMKFAQFEPSRSKQ